MNVGKKFIATTNAMTVAVIGGGIAGLATALAFARRGASVCVYERAPALTEVGAGLQISPNGARVLQALQVDVVGFASQAVVPMDGLRGRPVTRFDLASQSPPYRFVHRATLIAALAQACRRDGVQIVLGARVDGPLQADLVVGAEGIKSPLRNVLNGAEKPFFTGQVAWRTIVEADADPVARIWMLPGRHVVTYPLAESRLNVVAVQERDAWADEGWHHADAPANLATAFADAAPALQGILGKAEQVNLWGLFRHKVAPKWVTEKVALVGDAAHPTLPFLAQGANLALEDAYVLAAIVGEKGLAAGLPAYQASRKPRVARAIRAANANAVNYHLKGARRWLSHKALWGIGLAAPGLFMRRLSWLYDHDVTA